MHLSDGRHQDESWHQCLVLYAVCLLLSSTLTLNPVAPLLRGGWLCGAPSRFHDFWGRVRSAPPSQVSFIASDQVYVSLRWKIRVLGRDVLQYPCVDLWSKLLWLCLTLAYDDMTNITILVISTLFQMYLLPSLLRRAAAPGCVYAWTLQSAASYASLI